MNPKIENVGKEIEILVYTKEELIPNKPIGKKTFADFSGILSEEDFESIKSNTKQAREQWSRDI